MSQYPIVIKREVADISYASPSTNREHYTKRLCNEFSCYGNISKEGSHFAPCVVRKGLTRNG